LFDWAFGELSYGHAAPEFLDRAVRHAREHGRVQVVTMPKKSNYDEPNEWHRRTRQTIATAYAAGGLCMVPWDVYMPGNAPRYFGTPPQYAHLFGFVRAAAEYLDGYEDAAVAGRGLKETRYGQEPPVVLSGGSGEVRAFARAQPDRPDVPVVIHLVEWAAPGQPFRVALRRACFFGDRPLELTLLVPAEYDRAAHQQAEQSGDFSALAVKRPLRATTQDGLTVADVPALRPWGLLVLSKEE
jgi:hypothetical protein